MLSRAAQALAIALVVDVVVVLLLTPIGFESRPPSALRIVGYVAIVTIFVGLGLFLVSIGLLFRNAGLASKLAIVGSIFFFIPILGDRAGYFFSLPIPFAVNILEYVLVAALLVTLYLSSMVYRERKPASG